MLEHFHPHMIAMSSNGYHTMYMFKEFARKSLNFEEVTEEQDVTRHLNVSKIVDFILFLSNKIYTKQTYLYFIYVFIIEVGTKEVTLVYLAISWTTFF